MNNNHLNTLYIIHRLYFSNSHSNHNSYMMYTNRHLKCNLSLSNLNILNILNIHNNNNNNNNYSIHNSRIIIIY